MTKVCTILVGAPGSGKSTWLNNQDHLDDAWVASTDDIIEEIATALYGMTYDEGFKDLIKFAEKVMWRDLMMAAEDGDRIYVDRTNMSVKGRKRFIDALKPYGYTFEAVVFDKPDDEDEWIRRLNSRPGKTIPEAVINGMLAAFQMPTVEEGFASVTVIEP